MAGFALKTRWHPCPQLPVNLGDLDLATTLEPPCCHHSRYLLLGCDANHHNESPEVHGCILRPRYRFDGLMIQTAAFMAGMQVGKLRLMGAKWPTLGCERKHKAS